MKMYVILRSDIYMDAGKAAAQAGHAFAHTTMLGMTTERIRYYHPNGAMGTKIVLKAPLKEIRRLRNLFRRLDIPNYLVVDEGHVFPPDFDGKKIVTALGVGPLFFEESGKYLHHLDLFSVKKKPSRRRKH